MGSMRSIFGLASSYWGLFIFIPFFILSDIFSLGGLIIGAVRGTNSRIVYSLLVRTAAVVIAGLFIVLGSFSARYPKITNYSISVEKPLPGKALRIILVSDTHIGSLVHKKQIAGLVSRINSLDADLVLFAGDILDRDITVYKNENLNEEFGKIKSRYGVFAVPGNHDYFGGNIGELKKQLSAAGIYLLTDETILVNNAFYLTGRNDFSAGRWGAGRKPLRDLTFGLDASLPLIVMDHQPVNLSEAESCGADLQVSGHTHHGQIWPGPLITKRIYENDYGLLKKGKTSFIVTSGYGTWGPPIRIGTRSEIVCIELKNHD